MEISPTFQNLKLKDSSPVLETFTELFTLLQKYVFELSEYFVLHFKLTPKWAVILNVQYETS